MIVDAQVHLWTSGRKVTPANAHHRQQAVFSKDDLLPEMDRAGVDRVIIVPPSWDDNEHAFAAAAAHPDRFAVMGRVKVDAPESREILRKWKGRPGALGIRLVFNPEHSHLLVDGKADWIWPAAEAAGIPVMMLAPGHLDRFAKIAQAHPQLRLAVDHMGLTRNRKGPRAFDHLPELLALAKHPNIAVKITGLPLHSAEAYPFLDLHEPLRRTVDAFGPERVFWGTDLSRMTCSYRQCVTFITEEIDWLSRRDKELIMGKAVCAWLGWDGYRKT
ncbi:4-sulfomuconolactone hydrolase [Pigmentiphaga humi]|uniref:4-sulfomuconolactone hydrolase n=1 Tax=Pigmentiphaga humi TaxID=2478468 RepID=A0A3P4B3R6_9BURK|nr:amidohydrolase family protein [Pigmentiphaga humi]VCU70561.1 4-sulfomuconolactone hydrolase [Pigmentiphaga humi]